MTLVTGTVQDLGYDGMEGTLWARPARFRSDGQVVYAPERKPYKVVDGVVSADLAPGPAVLELQVGSHARGTFEVVIPEEDTTLADLLDTVFPWEPAQVSMFVAEREAAEQAKAEAEAAAGQATAAAQQTGQDRTHVDQVRTELEEAYDASEAGQALPPRLTEAALNATYLPRDEAEDLGGVKTVNGVAPGPDGEVTIPVGNPDAVIGTGITRMSATYDLNQQPLDGEFLIYYEAPTLTTDFSEHPTGPGIPEGWTERWVSGATWAIADEPTALGGKVLQMSGATSSRAGLRFDAAGQSSDVEIVVKFRPTSNSAYLAAVVRGGGEAGTESGYTTRRTSSSMLSGRYVDGVSTNMGSPGVFPEVGSWWIMRKRIAGDTMQVRLWEAGAPEPTTWGNVQTANHVPGPGWTGLMNFGSGITEVDWVSVALDGHTAPLLGGA